MKFGEIPVGYQHIMGKFDGSAGYFARTDSINMDFNFTDGETRVNGGLRQADLEAWCYNRWCHFAVIVDRDEIKIFSCALSPDQINNESDR